ncbi:UNVERIFIED_CONTAM: hypothetical protein Slati_1339200 [Sesamum latifolium]|uniref:Uncharacterized protein n=1 Tax=Sesamum latifolium TaxID=2727402 RepID=A0AAW2XN26_9LAMI
MARANPSEKQLPQWRRWASSSGQQGRWCSRAAARATVVRAVVTALNGSSGPGKFGEEDG